MLTVRCQVRFNLFLKWKGLGLEYGRVGKLSNRDQRKDDFSQCLNENNVNLAQARELVHMNKWCVLWGSMVGSLDQGMNPDIDEIQQVTVLALWIFRENFYH